MLQFFFRIALAIATAILSVIVFARVVLDSPAEELSLKTLSGHAIIHAKTLSETPPSERRAQAKKLSRTLGYGVRMEPRSSGKDLRTEWRTGSLFLIAPVPNTPGQLTLGPLPYGRVADIPTVVALIGVVALLTAALALRPLLLRIQSMGGAAERMRRGDFSTRVASVPGDPLEGLGRSLNQLADRIGQLLSDERDLLRTVAHEVRAPISRMRFRVEKLADRVDERSRRDATGLISDLRQVDSLFEELLTYVAFDEFDYERPELQTAPVAVKEAVKRLVEEVTATEEEVTVEVHGSNDSSVIANQKLFDRAVTNLLLNAVAYGGPQLQVFIREFAEEVTIDVQDSGPGIPEGDRPKVVKPFVRLAKKKTRGTGLGLAIVSRIMALHRGRLHILGAPTGGASIQLVWRNAKPQPRKRWPIHLFSSRS